MGSTLSAVKDMIKSSDDAKGKEHEVQEALENMRVMAADQLMMFNERIRNQNFDQHLIPIAKILTSFEYIRCDTSEENNIGPAIKEAVKDFSTGPVADGIANTACSVLTRLLGESSGTRQMQSQYMISIDPTGGISRLDALFFVYRFASTGLMKTAKSVVAVCVVKSSANIEHIDDNTLRVLVNQCFETSEIDIRKAIYRELQAAIIKNEVPSLSALNIDDEVLKEFRAPKSTAQLKPKEEKKPERKGPETDA